MKKNIQKKQNHAIKLCLKLIQLKFFELSFEWKQSLRLFNVHWQGIPIGLATKKHRALMKAEQRDYWWVGAFSLSALSDSRPIKVKKNWQP